MEIINAHHALIISTFMLWKINVIQLQSVAQKELLRPIKFVTITVNFCLMELVLPVQVDI